MKSFYEELKRYFETTDKDKIKSDWEKYKHLDKVGITVDEFLKQNEKLFKNKKNSDEQAKN